MEAIVEYGVTGTKEPITGAARLQLVKVLRVYKDGGYRIQHNGDCINADHEMARHWRRMGGIVYGHPPENNLHRAWFAFDNQSQMVEKYYRVRNEDIVNASRRLLAMPKSMSEEIRSGTWMTIRLARARHLFVDIIWPDGSITTEEPK